MATYVKLTVLLAALVAMPTAIASAQQAPTDPDAGTPAGTIYQLPLDQARVDAAPRRTASDGRGGAGAATGSAGVPTRATPATASALRSENGFGSSSVVPGVESEGRVGGSSASESTATGSAATKSSAGAAGAAEGVTASSGPHTPAASSPSSTRVYLLLALVLAVGIAGGLATRVRAGGDRSV